MSGPWPQWCKGDRVRRSGSALVGTVKEPGGGDWDGFPLVTWDDDSPRERVPSRALVKAEDLTTVTGVLEALVVEKKRHNERMNVLVVAMAAAQAAQNPKES